MSIRKRGRKWQVRVAPFPETTVETRTAAVALETDFKLRNQVGDLYTGPPATLGEEIDAFLERKRTLGGRRGALRPRSVEHLERSAKAWAPLRDRAIPTLRRREIEDATVARAKQHPRSARNELELLKAVLQDARDRGQRVDDAIFRIPAVRHNERRGRALTVDELDELTSFAPEYVKRAIAFAGTSAMRENEIFQLDEQWLDLAGGTLTVPETVNKSRREKPIALLASEVTLLREQLLARPAGTTLLFPKSNGRPWNRHHFRDRVWLPAALAAGFAHLEPRDGKTVTVADLTFHDLRHTATSLMCVAGLQPELVAARRGDADGGALVLRRYRHLYPGERAAAAVAFEAFLSDARGTRSSAAVVTGGSA